MVADTIYPSDTRAGCAATTVASLPGQKVTFLVLKEQATPRTYELDGVAVQELAIEIYRGKSGSKYIGSYV